MHFQVSQIFEPLGMFHRDLLELDESEGFILLGRRREKDFLSTWALLEGQVLATCDDTSLPEAPSTRAATVTRG